MRDNANTTVSTNRTGKYGRKDTRTPKHNSKRPPTNQTQHSLRFCKIPVYGKGRSPIPTWLRRSRDSERTVHS
jgi:hypothetical protein